MSIPPFASDPSLWLWFDSVLFCFSIFFCLFVCLFVVACNKAWSSLFNLAVYILMLCEVFALGQNLWVVDVNDILTFGSRMMSSV
jgi:hypothetical protein